MKFIKLEIQNLASLDRIGGETINFEEGALGTVRYSVLSVLPVAASLRFLTLYALRYTIVHHAIHARKATAIRISKYSAI